MRKLILLSGIMLISTMAYAAGQPEHSGHMGSMMKEDHSMKPEDSSSPEAESKAIAVGNKICPVTGAEIGTMGAPVTYEYKGKIYNFCCQGCVATFKADPEKYIKIIEENMGSESGKDRVKNMERDQTHQSMMGHMDNQEMPMMNSGQKEGPQAGRAGENREN